MSKILLEAAVFLIQALYVYRLQLARMHETYLGVYVLQLTAFEDRASTVMKVNKLVRLTTCVALF